MIQRSFALMACIIATLLAVRPASAQPAGTSAFSEVQLQPVYMPAAGGTLGVSVTITDSVGAQSAWVQVRYPDGNESKFDLQRQGSSLTKATWSGTITLDRNWAEADQFLTLVFSSKNSLGKYSRSADTQILQESLPPNRPRISITTMPRYAYAENTAGIVFNAKPEDYAAAILIWVPSWGLVSKPYCSSILTGLDQFGRFSQAYATGGNDGSAIWLTAYLMPRNVSLPCINANGPATPYEDAAVARAGGYRDAFQPAKQFKFGGMDWQARTSIVGYSYFIGDEVTVDSQGMHFKVAPCHNPGKADPNALMWCSAEARLLRPAGYGTYTATVTGQLGKLAPDIYGGLFVYGDQVSFSHREIDLQFWQDAKIDQNQHQFVVQPAGTDTQKRYAVPADLSVATFRFRWEPNRITYTTWSGSAAEPTPQTQLATWTFDRTSSATDVPAIGDQQVHFSLGIRKARGTPSTLADPGAEEVILNTFRYEPLKPGLVPIGVTNAASYTRGAISPGMVISIFGYYFGGESGSTLRLQDGKVSTELSGTRVFFDGVPAPLLYAQWGQVNAVVPFSVSGATTKLEVEYNGARSDPVILPVVPSLPGIFSLYASGQDQGAIINLDGSVNGPGNPIARGSYVSLYATGVGAMSQSVTDGTVTGYQNMPLLTLPVKVTVGNIDAKVTYAGAASGIVAGVNQITVQVPASAPVGAAIPVLIQVGGRPSQGAVTLAVK